MVVLCVEYLKGTVPTEEMVEIDTEEERWDKMPMTVSMPSGLDLILNAVGKLLKGLKGLKNKTF